MCQTSRVDYYLFQSFKFGLHTFSFPIYPFVIVIVQYHPAPLDDGAFITAVEPEGVLKTSVVENHCSGRYSGLVTNASFLWIRP